MIAGLSLKRQKSSGIVMGVVGEVFLLEGLAAARNIKERMDVQIDITTNQCGFDFLKCHNYLPFDKVHVIDNYKGIKLDHTSNRFVKIRSMTDTRFAKSVFLDTDIFILEDISEMFCALEVWDLLACHAPGRITSPDEDYLGLGGGKVGDVLDYTVRLKSLYPEVNAGVIGFSNSKKARNTILKWLEYYYRQYIFYNNRPEVPGYFGDQGSLRRAILSVRPNMYIMPPEFNVRIIFPYFIGRGKAKVLHGRDQALQKAVDSINTSEMMRVGVPSLGLIGLEEQPS